MSATTVGKLAEMIRTAYYKKYANDNANYTLRHIGEQVGQELAYQAKADAMEMDHLGEAMFSNDQFVTVYRALPLQTDGQGYNYIPFPNPPAGLPQGREVAYIGVTGNKKTQIFPIRNKDLFMQGETRNWMILAYVENGNIVFENLSPLITGPFDLKLVGALPVGTNLLDLPLNLPKSSETAIMDRILAKMISQRQVTPDFSNDGIEK